MDFKRNAKDEWMNVEEREREGKTEMQRRKTDRERGREIER